MGPIGVTYADAGKRNGCRDTVQLLEWDAAIDVHGWSSSSRAPSGRAPGQVRAPRAGPAINLNPLGPVHGALPRGMGRCGIGWTKSLQGDVEER